VGWGKVASWSTKAAISLKRVKIQEKLLWRAYMKSPALFRTVPSSTPYSIPFHKIGRSQPHPKFQSLLSQERDKATDFKFGRNIHRVNPNKSPLKSLEKREGGRIQGVDYNFFGYPLLSQERVKLRTSNLAGTFTGSIRTKTY